MDLPISGLFFYFQIETLAIIRLIKPKDTFTSPFLSCALPKVVLK